MWCGEGFDRCFFEVIPRESIGVTGSLATGNATDGYSDIDIVIKEKEYRELIRSDVFFDGDIEFRDKTQWIEFYKHYGIFCALSAEEFARAAQMKKQQFIFRGIPVSIFIDAGNDFLQFTNSLSQKDVNSMEIIKGRVMCENLIRLPGYAFVKCLERIIVVVNMHRTYPNCMFGPLSRFSTN